jgi:hypothetical protein
MHHTGQVFRYRQLNYLLDLKLSFVQKTLLQVQATMLQTHHLLNGSKRSQLLVLFLSRLEFWQLQFRVIRFEAILQDTRDRRAFVLGQILLLLQDGFAHGTVDHHLLGVWRMFQFHLERYLRNKELFSRTIFCFLTLWKACLQTFQLFSFKHD